MVKVRITVLLLFLISLGIPSPPAYAERAITVNGSSTVQPIVTIAGRIFGKKEGIRIIVRGGGSSKGVRSVGKGIVDMGNASRDIYPGEKKKYPDLIAHTIGYDGIAIIVNRDNPVNSLTSEQVIALYTGKIRNWKSLGGRDVRAKLISKEFGRSTLDLFIEHFNMEVKEKNGLMYYRLKEQKKYQGVGAEIIGQNSEAIVAVSKDPGAIGYVSIGAAERAEMKLGTIKRVKLDGIAPTKENVKNKTYPITRPLNVITKGQPTGKVKKFIEYLYSRSGQNIVKNLDYIPVR